MDDPKFESSYLYEEDLAILDEKLQTMQQEGQGVSVDLFVVMYALHNKIDRNYRQILNSASKEANNAMFVQNVEVMGMRLTIAQLYYEVDTVATSMMISQMAQIPMEDGRYTTLTVWEMYEDNYGLFTKEMGYSGYFYLHPNADGAKVLGGIWANSILELIQADGIAIKK